MPTMPELSARLSADPATLENRQLMAIPPCSHLMSNHDGSLVVGDGA
ncbi:TPA: hypothetical protein MC696_003355, partial [Klebsiella oxytoca]|nr:hypothetical protein [Klebsiella oxytoca]ELN5375325.1 hypothetical protein [Klebsiella oxytoca]HBU7059142.1 hypothetical protein [Klebsiella oxytoca]HBU7490190.1 hypothetical protein [Klebsiella oxytoca]HCK2578551.1 hypothetical protein [Klebsiella oxytoca]